MPIDFYVFVHNMSSDKTITYNIGQHRILCLPKLGGGFRCPLKRALGAFNNHRICKFLTGYNLVSDRNYSSI